jgi:hypothetical protein
VVLTPWDIDDPDELDAWLAEHRPACPCGVTDCSKLRLALVPDKAPSIEAWMARYGDWMDQTPDERKAAQARWYQRYMGDGGDAA